MPRLNQKSFFVLIAVFLGAWLALKYLLPIGSPFLLGLGLAFAAEPVVRLLSRRLRRGFASLVGVALTLILLTAVLVLLAALLVREVGLLANALPDLSETARNGLTSLEGFLLNLAQQTPDGIQPLFTQTVSSLFSSGSAILEQLLQRLPSMASALLGWIPGSALALGTGILSAFMVSVRLPRLKQWFSRLAPDSLLSRYLPVLKQIRTAILGWLKAQLKLAGLCLLIVGGGLILLRVPYAPIWAVLIALVDAVPVLGTGTVLLPWSLICLIQGQSVRAVGLAATYVTAMLSRTVLEPRLVGKQLGLDPLLTLVALYAGFQLWGLGGMLISPLVCVAAQEIARARA